MSVKEYVDMAHKQALRAYYKCEEFPACEHVVDTYLKPAYDAYIKPTAESLYDSLFGDNDISSNEEL